MHIIADDRELRSGVVERLQTMEGVSVVVGRLGVGDYVVDERVVFERKTIPDFALSVVDGRLFRQACRLASSRYQPVIVLEGAASDWNATGMRREAIQGAIITLTVLLNIPLLRSLDAAETARLIRYTGEQIERSTESAVARPGYRPKGKRKRQLFILQGLPGIGPARAERLLDEFSTVEGVMKADAESLARVKGVGPKTAEAIRQVVREAPATYGDMGVPLWPDD